MTNVL